MIFKNRKEAGKLLSKKLLKYKNKKDVIMLAIPRGGVEVGFEISKTLNIELDIIVTKKIGLPGNEEFAIGAVGPDKKLILGRNALKKYNISAGEIKKYSGEIGNEIERRYKSYKGAYELPKIKNRRVIITDDGVATGFTIKSAVDYARNKSAKKIIVAVPVAPYGFVIELKDKVDEFICLHSPKDFFAVGEFYEEFPQLADDDVKRVLKKIKYIEKFAQKLIFQSS